MSHIYLANALDMLAPPKSKTTSGKQVFTLTRFDIVGEHFCLVLWLREKT